ncbi:hypothetical protein HK18_05145 [Commensalibacter intestini]|uniref:Uncharacterized protein n=2 Tax=Commensalibacter intestini TaxID=479936 RepID=A0A251ZSJ1_9PROT|nr:hypothetical protein HK18_05145 [Commensalibacter intestini]
MRRLGIHEDVRGKGLLLDHFNKVIKDPSNIVDTFERNNQFFEVRHSLLFGPSGKATMLETTFESMSNNTKRFITTIPKEGIR